MYNYSPIKKMYIKNFRNIGEAELDFTDSPIITLVGENEAGKTSVIKAFTTCTLNANPRDQKDYIRDNTKMFGVALDLEDGTRVVRIKETSGINAYQVFKDEKLIWNTNKITDGLPEEVKKVMGLIAEPETNEFLHIRTYEDKLLFVVTPNSTNYKVMYNALKVEQLTKAIKNGSTEVNALKSEINSNDIKMNALNNQMVSIQVYDIEPLTSVRDRLTSQLSILDKLEKAKKLSDRASECERQLGALALLDKFSLSEINELTASKFSKVSNILNRHNEVSILRNLLNSVVDTEEIRVDVLNKIKHIIDKDNELKVKINRAGALIHVNKISEISEIEIIQLNKAMALLNSLNTLNSRVSLISTDSCNEVSDTSINALTKLQRISALIKDNKTRQESLAQINQYIGQVQDYMKQCGVAVETCPNCGESVIFDVDKIGD